MTFFDKAGNEMPIPSATVALTPASGAASIVAPRILEPGHFVTDVPLVAGILTVDVIGQAPGGNPEQAHLSIEIKP
jgi:hypothetical protein